MHVRIARFENIDAARVDEDAEQFRKMRGRASAPSGCRGIRSRRFAMV